MSIKRTLRLDDWVDERARLAAEATGDTVNHLIQLAVIQYTKDYQNFQTGQRVVKKQELWPSGWPKSDDLCFQCTRSQRDHDPGKHSTPYMASPAAFDADMAQRRANRSLLHDLPDDS